MAEGERDARRVARAWPAGSRPLCGVGSAREPEEVAALEYSSAKKRHRVVNARGTS